MAGAGRVRGRRLAACAGAFARRLQPREARAPAALARRTRLGPVPGAATRRGASRSSRRPQRRRPRRNPPRVRVGLAGRLSKRWKRTLAPSIVDAVGTDLGGSRRMLPANAALRQYASRGLQGERALFSAWREGDARAREALVERFMPLARALARR